MFAPFRKRDTSRCQVFFSFLTNRSLFTIYLLVIHVCVCTVWLMGQSLPFSVDKSYYNYVYINVPTGVSLRVVIHACVWFCDLVQECWLEREATLLPALPHGCLNRVLLFLPDIHIADGFKYLHGPVTRGQNIHRVDTFEYDQSLSHQLHGGQRAVSHEIISIGYGYENI